MTWQQENGNTEGHEGSAFGVLADGLRFTCHGAAAVFSESSEDGESGGRPPEVRDPRIVHLRPCCRCGWRGMNVPAAGELVASGENRTDWLVPEEAVAPARELWQQHVTAVGSIAVPPWHTVRWAEQNLALRQVTAEQPLAALRLLRKILSDVEMHRMAAVASAREWGLSWTDLAAQSGLDEEAVQRLHRRTVDGC
ncbi:hypothetical protein ACFYZJ_31195 [Streptomyces sp. NPDC001848]|uniref:hypothetical protein n=1 Tax=Streptomyces sp. NPDC001848 TaxID=3364618 RepID=UPI00367475E8